MSISRHTDENISILRFLLDRKEFHELNVTALKTLCDKAFKTLESDFFWKNYFDNDTKIFEMFPWRLILL